jgi:signal peptidase I
MAGTTEEWVWAPQPGVSAPEGARPGRRALWVCLAVVVAGVLTVAVAVGLMATGYHAYRVSSASMEPTLRLGDRVLVHRIGAGGLHRGDVVLISAPEWASGGLVIKRVVGVGGDRLSLGADGRLTVNGVAVAEPYAMPVPGWVGRPVSVTVPPGRLFLLGDHREDSYDSRFSLDVQQGSVSTAGLRGRVEWVASGSAYHSLKPTRAFASVGDGKVAGTGPLPGYLAVAAVGGAAVLLGLVATPVVLAVSRRRARAAAVR